jgi:hypothetical protein
MNSRIRDFLANPLSGLAPWIVMAVMSGIVRFELAVGLSLLSAVVIVVANRLTGGTLKLLEFSDVAFFLVLAIVGLLASDAVMDWLRTWSGELSNIALVVIALGSILIRRPFTLGYAKESTPKEFWDSPAFLRTNYVITWAWALAFIVAAVSGFIGDAVIDNSDNLWTGWIIQTAAMLAAVQFTLWYPRVVRARGRAAAGIPGESEPPMSELFAGLVGYLPLIGIVSLAFDAAPWWVGVALIVAGPVIGGQVAKDRRAVGAPAADEPSAAG